MTPDYLKNLCYSCDDCYTITFIGKPNIVFINDKKAEVYYSWNTYLPNEVQKHVFVSAHKEIKLIKEDIEILLSVGIQRFYNLFQQGVLKGSYK